MFNSINTFNCGILFSDYLVALVLYEYCLIIHLYNIASQCVEDFRCDEEEWKRTIESSLYNGQIKSENGGCIVGKCRFYCCQLRLYYWTLVPTYPSITLALFIHWRQAFFLTKMC